MCVNHYRRIQMCDTKILYDKIKSFLVAWPFRFNNIDVTKWTKFKINYFFLI